MLNVFKGVRVGMAVGHGYAFKKDNSVELVFLPSESVVSNKRKEFLPYGSLKACLSCHNNEKPTKCIRFTEFIKRQHHHIPA